MTLLLKQLDIHGFKSFATATTFVFDRGITAIVGPNGSGKSNVAEALRWVLGEQGHANLRSRKTEDVIFAGSEKRALLGMAEVVLTLDNADGDLPLPFSELTVARRAFRSGENQYLINGSRMRLKDVQQLVAPLGQAYTIIGQGLVDAALSQKPDERRGLFEHAAGIGGLRLRANDAERSLAETAANAQRLHDILGELEPRVRSLERQARQAREYGALRDRLLTLQRQSYGLQWRDSEARIAVARAELKQADADLAATEAHHTRAARRLGESRGEERRLAEQARALTATVAEGEQALAAARHRLELHDAQAQAVADRLADLHATCDDLTHRQAEAVAELDTLGGEQATLAERLAALECELAEAQAAWATARERRAALERELAAGDARLLDLSRGRAEAEGMLGALADRKATLDAEAERLTHDTERDKGQLAALDDALCVLRERHVAAQAEIAELDAQRTRLDTELRTVRDTLSERQADIERRERELAALHARLELLERAHAAGEGLHAGPRALVRAVQAGKLTLPGLHGTLAELIEVPAEYETAIEVALGGHLQDIVVERWTDAESAIDFLKLGNLGRATFQPLDTVRPSRAKALVANDPDTRGVATSLVTYPERIAPVVEGLLNNTLVVADLEATRRVLRATPDWTVVTLAGEIARPAGSVTGGGRIAEAGVLSRERERRSIPKSIATGERELAKGRAGWEAEHASAAALAQRLYDVTAQLERAQLQARQVAADITRAEHDRSAFDAAIGDLRTRERSLDDRRAEVRAAERAARERAAALAREHDETVQRRVQLVEMLAAAPLAPDEAAGGLRTAIAAARERREALATAARRARERADDITGSLAARGAEIERIEATIGEKAGVRQDLVDAIARLDTQLAGNRAALPPLTDQRARLTQELADAERTLDHATQAVREAERERDRASLGLARGQDEQVFLAERIRNDLEIDDPGALVVPPANDAGSTDPTLAEQEIQRLRERLRRMSAVGEDVLALYETEAERLAFLTQQLDDVDGAAAGLRRVLADLNGKMTARFNETFRDVAAAFEETFKRLFGGGTARLLMNEGDDGSTAIEIVAQPPGKRLASLSALSGGERALTAVALLVAIQRVNPSPFCLLDEVDAALDEANVVRFRDELRELAAGTQFIVITHNRGTIEGADTLYGVTMGDDSISRVISLRLDEAVRAVEEREAVQTAGG